MDGNSRDPSIGVAEKEVAAAAARDFEPELFKNANQFLALQAGKASYRDLLNANQFKVGRTTVIFQAEFDSLSHAFHERVEILGLGVTAPQSRDGCHIVSVFITFDEDGEFARRLHFLDFNIEDVQLGRVYPPSFSKNLQIVSIPR